MSQDSPVLPAGAPPGDDGDPGHDLTTKDGYLAELVRSRRLAMMRQDTQSADRLMALIGKMAGHFVEPEQMPEREQEIQTILDVVKRLVKQGIIKVEDLSA